MTELILQCPCQSGKLYKDCCEPLHNGDNADTANALMRSRYAAYTLHKAAYLHRSWSAQTRPSKQSLKKSPPLNWLRLEIIRVRQGTALDNTGVVEFIATYRDNTGEEQTLHETSRFVRENGRWVYLDGQ